MPINYTQLLSKILSRQEVSNDTYEIDNDRHKLMTLGDSKPTLEEQAILFRSARLRQKLILARHALISDATEMICQEHNLSILPLAASSNNQDEIVIKNESFSVCIYKNSGKYGSLIQIILEPDLFRKIKPGINIRLVDSGGLEWAIGCPDENGELVSLWQDAEVELADRIKNYTLSLDFI